MYEVKRKIEKEILTLTISKMHANFWMIMIWQKCLLIILIGNTKFAPSFSKGQAKYVSGQMSLKNGKLNVPQKGQVECPSKRAGSNVPQKGQVKCPSKGKLNVPPPQKGKSNVP